MRANLRDLKRTIAKQLRPKPPEKPTKVTSRGFTQQRGQPYRPQGRGR